MTSGLDLHDIQAVLFDLDGTLVDTAPDLLLALNATRAEAALPALPLAHIRPYVSHGARAILCQGMPIHEAHRDFDHYRQRILHHYSENICVDSNIFPALDTMLHDLTHSDLAWGIVTNKPSRFTLPLLESLKIKSNCVVCGDSTEHLKPHPAPMLFASDLIQIDPAHCLYFGDSSKDIEAASAAGMKTVSVSYGYIPPDQDPLEWRADMHVDTSQDVANLISKIINEKYRGLNPALACDSR